APCPIEVMKRVNSEMNMGEVTIAYGMTETSPVSFQSAVDDPLDRRVSTVGRIHPHVEVKVVDLDGKIVKRGERGELCTRGYSVELCAWIRVRSGETLTLEEVRAFCAGQIAHNKIPRYVEFVDEFPMTVTGKIQKFLMRDEVEQRLGLKAAKTA